MNPKQELRKMVYDFNDTTKRLFAIAYNELKNNGKDDYWIYLAIKDKPITDWEKYGFGLIFNEKFIKHIDYEYNRNKVVYSNEKSTDEMLREIFGE